MGRPRSRGRLVHSGAVGCRKTVEFHSGVHSAHTVVLLCWAGAGAGIGKQNRRGHCPVAKQSVCGDRQSTDIKIGKRRFW